MPHLVLEYSANLEGTLDIGELVRVVHETALETGVFPLGGIRTRAERRDIYRIADGNPENRFVHLTARIGTGRTLEARQEAGDIIFAALCGALQSVFDIYPLAISFEVQEAHPQLNFKKNNIHKKLEQNSANSSEPGKSHE